MVRSFGVNLHLHLFYALGSTPIRLRATVVDNFVSVQRLKEEIELPLKEMVDFMAYYRNHVLQQLETQHLEIRETILGSVLNVSYI